jgi:Tol biopolymer transport system component
MKRFASLVSILVISSSIVAVGSSPAGATFPGGNGDIAYLTRNGARAMQADGTGDHPLATTEGYGLWDVRYSPDGSSIVFTDFNQNGARIVQQDLATGDRSVILKRSDAPGSFIDSVAFSPDGSSVVFCSSQFVSRLFTVGTDGSGLVKVASSVGYCFADWSVDDRIVASKGIFIEDGDRLVTTMDADGSNQEVIATLPPAKQAWGVLYLLVPTWAPDGSEVAFTAQRHRIHPDIWSVNADGSDLHKLTDTKRVSEAGPVYSPDGTLVAFGRSNDFLRGDDLWVMGSDGSSPTQITDTHRSEYPRSWQSTSGMSGAAGPTMGAARGTSSAGSFSWSERAGWWRSARIPGIVVRSR